MSPHASLESLEVSLPDGRKLELVVTGPADGLPLVYHHGTPGAAVPFMPAVEAASSRGLRSVLYSRAGYAGSTRHPGRSVADVAGDIAAVLDHLGSSRFVTAGWSGGGPHALACAALLPERCAAAATIAGVAPHGVAGLDWLAGMGPENLEEFGKTLEGESALRPWLEREAAHFDAVAPADVAAALGGLVSEVDKAALTGQYAEFIATSLRASVSAGVDGWCDDDLACARPWGFELGELRSPVSIWQGDQDRMVPFSHGVWLAAHVRGCDAHLLPGEGHLSLSVTALDSIFDDLLAKATV